MTAHCIIIGGGHAAATLGPALREQGWTGGITLITEEPIIPYQRPPLSKAFLAGEKSASDIALRPAEAYQQADIALILNQRVTAINRKARTISLADGRQLAYTRLVLAVGAEARRVPLPGVDLDGICYLRSLADAEQIRRQIRPDGDAVTDAVILGGGYIGLEAASVLNRLGMRVTVLEMQGRVLQRVTAPQVSAFYHRIHTEEGVTIRCNTGIAEFRGEGKVGQVVCTDGAVLPAQLVVIGVGVLPRTALAEAAGLAVEDGIKVNSRAETSDPAIYAAGDCTCHYNPFYGRWLRLESVQNAAEQARSAAMALCGKPQDSQDDQALPWFWSDQYDLKLQIAGLSSGYEQLIIRGDIDNSRRFAAFYLRSGRIIAVDAVNRPAEFMFGKRLIMQRTLIDAERLADASVPIKTLLQAA